MRILAILSLVLYGAVLEGCATSNPAAGFMAQMDSLPPDKQLPNWESTKALMMRNPPKVGDIAPDFTLTAKEGDATTRLSQFRDDRPVVLIFGSWT